MKQLTLVPNGWPCKFRECPPGPFVYMGKHLGIKTEYGDNEAFCDSGERYCLTGDDVEVQPVVAQWVETDG